ncbi:hypothetical protein B0H12DRAFT_437131 [Mycena haematopus]|nr:hypothetical protein B0H12DRAFT_437131 [Mycena haematopus]
MGRERAEGRDKDTKGLDGGGGGGGRPYLDSRIQGSGTTQSCLACVKPRCGPPALEHPKSPAGWKLRSIVGSGRSRPSSFRHNNLEDPSRSFVKHFLIPFQAGNEGIITLLEHNSVSVDVIGPRSVLRSHSVQSANTSQALAIYRRCCAQVELVVRFLGVTITRQLLTEPPVPNLNPDKQARCQFYENDLALHQIESNRKHEAASNEWISRHQTNTPNSHPPTHIPIRYRVRPLEGVDGGAATAVGGGVVPTAGNVAPRPAAVRVLDAEDEDFAGALTRITAGATTAFDFVVAAALGAAVATGHGEVVGTVRTTSVRVRVVAANGRIIVVEAAHSGAGAA